MPGFAVGVVEARTAVGAAAEEEAGDSEGGVQRDDVPGVLGDDVDGEEMDFAGKVGDGASIEAAMGVDAVKTLEELGGTLHLDAPQGRGGVGREGRDFGELPAAGSLFGGLMGILLFVPVCIFSSGIGGQECPPYTSLGHTTGEEVAGIEDYVVAFAVAVGAGDTEAEVGSLQDKLEFGKFSATLGVDFADTGALQERLCWERLSPSGLSRGSPFRDRVPTDRLVSDKLLSDRLRVRR